MPLMYDYELYVKGPDMELSESIEDLYKLEVVNGTLTKVEESDESHAEALFKFHGPSPSSTKSLIEQLASYHPCLLFDLRWKGGGFHGMYIIKEGNVLMDHTGSYYGRG